MIQRAWSILKDKNELAFIEGIKIFLAAVLGISNLWMYEKDENPDTYKSPDLVTQATKLI
jgi:hypothetical protein